ncbi:hypothetical protein AC481_01590 [miscellaneous Crenarchaeota group archaeon SMTZ-80]|nr:MAG: hypothetical protein AC481_01590 [miscellaneous Crenarchaeota group archaeon SMTZ-80]
MNTKNIFKLLLLFLFSLFVSSLAAETVAIVIKVKGDVKFLREGVVTSQALKRGFRLQDGDKITTGSKSYAAVRFIDDASMLRIRANSTCRIEGKKEKNQVIKNVYLEVGAILARVTQQRGKFTITTPTSVASVKGTEWISEHRIEGGTFYFGISGVVEISNEAGAALLHAGETVEVPDARTAPITRKSREGEGVWDEEFGAVDDFEFEFMNESGQKRMLRFRIETQE